MNIDEIIHLDEQYYMNTFGKRVPLCFTHGKGSTLYAQDGKAYTDFLAGISVNCLGYGDEGLAAALYEQAKKLIHCSNIFYNEPQVKLSELLFKASGGYKVFFSNSGSEANEGAFKLARKFFYTQNINKYEIISAKNSFHGRTLAAVAATGQEKYQKPYAPLPGGFINVEYNSITAIKEAINEHTAAVFLETIQGEGGILEADANYLKQIRALCDENNILLILDEVQTGIGRTGKLFSFEHFGIKPDIFTLAKGLGGGVPIGAFLAQPRVADAFTPGDHGTTLGGNPLVCAAGYYTINKLLNTGLINEAKAKGTYFKEKLIRLKAAHKSVVHVRGRGLLIGLELDSKINGKEIVLKAMEKGFIINCAGHNTLRLAPPFVITADEIDSLIQALDSILKEVE